MIWYLFSKTVGVTFMQASGPSTTKFEEDLHKALLGEDPEEDKNEEEVEDRDAEQDDEE